MDPCHVRRLRLAVMYAVLALATASTAQAQPTWTVINLHPAGSTESGANGVSGGQQVGYAIVAGVTVASLWSGTAASWVNLNPAGSLGSVARAVGGGQQVGDAFVGDSHASLWSGTAASWIDLNPAGSTESHAQGVSGGQQVGSADVPNFTHASLWNGSAASWVDLHPIGQGRQSRSNATAIGGGQQVGSIFNFSVNFLPSHASLWSGSAASWVDLNPAGSTESCALAVGGRQQVGYATVNDQDHASLWSGSAASWVDLHPSGFTFSRALAVSDGQQAGFAVMGSVRHAGVWSGNHTSWVDLHTFLPAEFANSIANGIFSDGIFTYVVGSGFNTLTGRNEALLWKAELCVDQDGDGLCDDWEINGIPYLDFLGVVQRYPLPGASPLRKDIFIEVDAMAGRAPTQAALDRVIASFNAAPVPAPAGVPGGLPGITLHVIVDENNLERHPYPDGFFDFHFDKALHFGTPLERANESDWPMVKEAKGKAFRYCIFADSHFGDSSSGLADYPGNDFMVTLGRWEIPGGTEQQQAGTFMHELGHTLNLGHGGDQQYTNYKPNYFSTMNYMWQSPKPWLPSGIGAGCWEAHFPNYSDRQLPTLDEHSLNELNGIQGHIPTISVPYSIPVGTDNCDTFVMCVALPSEPCLRYARFSGPVDWDNNCDSNTPATGPLDINSIRTGATPGEIMTGFDDWAHLLYNFKGQSDSAEGAIPANSPVEIDQATDLYLNSLPPPPPPPCAADFNSDGTLNADDLGDFITGYFNDPPDPRADFNADGVVNADDLGDYITAYFNGCA